MTIAHGFRIKLKAREEKSARSGRKPGGKPPTPPSETPRAEDQINLTDDESRIMKVAGGGFDQCYNAQALVDTETMLVVVSAVTQAANDKQQVEPMLDKLKALPEGLNTPASRPWTASGHAVRLTTRANSVSRFRVLARRPLVSESREVMKSYILR